MKGFRPDSKALNLVFLGLVLSAPGLAEEAQGHFNLATFLGQVLNFVILFGGLAYLLRKPLNEYLKDRIEQVAARLSQAEAMKQESLQKLEEARNRLNNLAGEIQVLKEQAREEAERERVAIRQEAEKEAERLRKLAREEIETMVRLSIRDLKAYAIDLSVSLAEKKIKEKLTPELHRKLIHRAIDRLRSTHEPSVNS
ncbi:MAG: ATP synthase F0 subunit B [Candidatus Aminicenantes bacterium]|nr:ATP synthase F0 subunit B [Candidatus Aminicenantes bacterium]